MAKEKLKKLDELEKAGFQKMGEDCMAKRDFGRAMIYRKLSSEVYVMEFDGHTRYVDDLLRNHGL